MFLASPTLKSGPSHILVWGFATANIAVSSSTVPYEFKFGKVGERANVQLKVYPNDAYGLVRGGTGEVITAPGNSTFDLRFTGTTNESYAFQSRNTARTIQNVTADSPLGNFDMSGATVSGNMNFNGGLQSLTIGRLGGPGDASLTIGAGSGQGAVLEIGHIENANITANAGIRALVTDEWRDTNPGIDTLTTTFLGVLRTGDFDPNVNISGAGKDVHGRVLGVARIEGTLRDSLWDINGGVDSKIGTIMAFNANNWLLWAEGNVEKLRILGDWLNPNFPGIVALEANTVGQFQLDTADTRDKNSNIVRHGRLSVGEIKINGANADNRAIRFFRVGTVEALTKLSAQNGGIFAIEARDWPARTLIESSWIDHINMEASGLLKAAHKFAASMTLSGTRPNQSFSLGTFNGKGGDTPLQFGTNLGGAAANDIAVWKLKGGAISIKASDVRYWKLEGKYLGGSTNIDKLRVSTFVDSEIATVTSIEVLTSFGFVNSRITVDNLKKLEHSRSKGVDALYLGTPEKLAFSKTNITTSSAIDILEISNVDETQVSLIRALGVNVYQRFGKTLLGLGPYVRLVLEKNLSVVGASYDSLGGGNYRVYIG